MAEISDVLYEFDSVHALMIITGLVPLLFSGFQATFLGWFGWTDFAHEKTTWDYYFMLPLTAIIYLGSCFAYMRYLHTHGQKITDRFASWPSTYEGGLSARFFLHNGIYSWFFVYTTCIISLIVNIVYLEGNAFCSPYVNFVWLDQDNTTFQLDTCNWEVWTREFSIDKIQDYHNLVHTKEWSSLYPELLELNMRSNTTYEWVPVYPVLHYFQLYYAYLQGFNAQLMICALILILTYNGSWSTSSDMDQYLSRQKAALDERCPEAWESWIKCEELAANAAQASIHTSFASGCKVGAFTLVIAPTIHALSWVPWDSFFVVSVFWSSLCLMGSWCVVHTSVYSKVDHVLHRIYVRSILLGKMVGG